jgi:Tfp pilus assembly protein PilV
MRIENRNDSCGLTLMELAIAMLIFLIGILALMQLLVVVVGLNQRSRDITLATSLAQGKADELLSYDFFSPALARGGVVPLKPETHPIAANPAPIAGYADFFDYDGKLTTDPKKFYFVRQWQIWSCNCASTCSGSCAPAAANDILKKITVTVTSMSPVFQGSFPSTTVVLYKTRIG